MKANEAPEKIYFSSIENGTHYYTEVIPFEREYIEYVRKDVFIKKARKWFNSKNGIVVTDTKALFEEFIDYMKGE